MNPDLKKKNAGKSEIVIKEVRNFPALSAEQNYDLFHQEISIMWAVSFHPYVVTLLGFCDSPNYIVTERLETDLLNIILTEPKVLETPPVVGKILFQIADAMVAIHNAGIIHRDLKSANILVQTYNPSHKIRIAVCDFGELEFYLLFLPFHFIESG